VVQHHSESGVVISVRRFVHDAGVWERHSFVIAEVHCCVLILHHNIA
jgi:hypothetical protein